MKLIEKGRGVCGVSWAKDEVQLVPDVHAFPGHIACDSASRSEIVLPIHKGGEVVADAGGDTSDDISGVYANGGSIFGGQDGGDGENALAWLRPDEAAGEPSISGDAVADEFASSMGDMINALMRKDSNYV